MLLLPSADQVLTEIQGFRRRSQDLSNFGEKSSSVAVFQRKSSFHAAASRVIIKESSSLVTSKRQSNLGADQRSSQKEIMMMGMQE